MYSTEENEVIKPNSTVFHRRTIFHVLILLLIVGFLTSLSLCVFFHPDRVTPQITESANELEIARLQEANRNLADSVDFLLLQDYRLKTKSYINDIPTSYVYDLTEHPEEIKEIAYNDLQFIRCGPKYVRDSPTDEILNFYYSPSFGYGISPPEKDRISVTKKFPIQNSKVLNRVFPDAQHRGSPFRRG